MGIFINDVKGRVYSWLNAGYGRRSMLIGLLMVGTLLVLPALDPLQAMIVLTVTVLGIRWVLERYPDAVFTNAMSDIKGMLGSIRQVLINQVRYFKGNKDQRESWTYTFMSVAEDRKREMNDTKHETSSGDEEYH